MVLDECLPEPLRADPRRHSHREEDLEDYKVKLTIKSRVISRASEWLHTLT